MSRTLTALLAAAALACAGAVYAQGTSPTDQNFDANRPSAGETGQSLRQEEEARAHHELTGIVVKVEKKTLYVRQGEAIVPLKYDPTTRFEGLSRGELKEGQEIRASFIVQNKTENIAKQISRR